MNDITNNATNTLTPEEAVNAQVGTPLENEVNDVTSNVVNTPIDNAEVVSSNYFYQGKKVTQFGERLVNDKLVATVTLEDGTSFDVSEDELNQILNK